MCGIAGIWGNPDEARLWRAVRTLAHRGPDDEGIWMDRAAGVGIGMRRLSIIDLAGGHQPMSNEDGSIWLVCNGEIYNYVELREELTGKGHRFATRSDTETIIHLYEEFGVDFAKRLRGMFAIALWDGRERQLVLARDRLGKKPLYYSETNGELLFGSEIKAVAALLGDELTIDDQALVDYLAWSMVPAPATIYRQIRALPAAHRVVVRNRRVCSDDAYWRLEVGPKRDVSAAEAVAQVDAALTEATRLRLRSDVPVGAFLSGGIDSGLVTALAARQCTGRLRTVCIGFEESAFDERPLARQVAQAYGTDHQELVVRADAGRILPTIAAAFDQPFANTSAIPNYYVAQAARQHLKVVLTGDGGDEVFAGYRRHMAARINGRLAWADHAALRPAWKAFRALLPRPRSFRTGYAFAQRLVRGMAGPPDERYLLWTQDMFGQGELRRLCGRHDWWRPTQPAERIAAALLDEYAAAGPVDRMMAMDSRVLLVDNLNVRLDICTMRHGLEARSPLLDHVLIEQVRRLPERLKLAGGRTKPLLRALAARYLPPQVCAAPKRGFEIPLVRWLQTELRELRDDVLLSRSGLLAERFDRRGLERLVRRPGDLEPARWAQHVIVLLMLGIWDRYVRGAREPEGGNAQPAAPALPARSITSGLAAVR